MLPFMPLLLEIVLLAATAYFYWMTRRLVTTRSPDSASSFQSNVEQRTEALEIARDLTELVTELQSAASAVRDDMNHQRMDIQDLLSRANTTIIELQTLIDKASQPSLGSDVRQVKDQEVHELSARTMGDAVVMTLAEALMGFGQELYGTENSERTVTTKISHVRGFITWLWGQRYDEVPLSRIGATEIEGYLDYIKSKNYRSSTIKRKLTTLQAFSDWVDMVLNSNGSLEITDNDQGASHCSKPDALASVSGQISQGNQQGTRAVNFTNPVFSSQTDLPIGGNRYQMVFTLADQGLDQSIIAARTGLEQEAIRMLLTFGGPSHISH